MTKREYNKVCKQIGRIKVMSDMFSVSNEGLIIVHPTLRDFTRVTMVDGDYIDGSYHVYIFGVGWKNEVIDKTIMFTDDNSTGYKHSDLEDLLKRLEEYFFKLRA